MRKRFVALALLAGPLAGMAQLQPAIDSVVKKDQLMGISLLTYAKGRVTGTYHSGLRDYERSLPVTDSTLFRIASLSKLVTTTGLMVLYDQHRFKLDDDVSRYLGFTLRNPNFPEVPITFRMLMSHTASLNDGDGYDRFLGDIYSTPGAIPSVKELLLPSGRYYTPNMWLAHRPGSYFTYCNANFGIIATLIERISGQRFDLYMREKILDPLGITGGYNVAEIGSIGNVAAIYRNKDGWKTQVDGYHGQRPSPRNLSGYELGTNGFLFGPQGGLRISALDLAKVMQLHLNGGAYAGKRLLRRSTIALMHTPQWRYNGTNGDTNGGMFQCWGLSVQLVTNTPKGDVAIEGIPLMGHAGDAYGLISGLYFEPKRGIGFVFMTNGTVGGANPGARTGYFALEEDIFRAVAPYFRSLK
ncbi:serine hydrolase domain-containing protein [uncultured Acetobacteroides sp.]|uniref:serine hydrolase domain-containing protein n=1 Tax=uncultured Acetobacteroides sp. TaxID=1760811 RepID=UPI0029F4F6C3|nr:serine hydrolase domain-containing protein [uncultured Acetobacteroides sp.]